MNNMNKDYSGNYYTTNDFVGSHNLQAKADELFGNGWTAEDDVNQIEQLINSLGGGYIVVVPEDRSQWNEMREKYDLANPTNDSNYDIFVISESEYDEFEAGGKVNRDKKIVKYKDGRKRKLSTWNEGAGYTKDRKYFNKSEDWEIPLNERAGAKSSSSKSKTFKRKSSGSEPQATKGKNYSYIPNAMLREAEIENKGKTTYIDAKDILDGIYVKAGTKYASGGGVKDYKYVPNYMIESVTVERNGKETEIDGGNILDGLYVKNTKFEEGGEATYKGNDVYPPFVNDNFDYGSDLTDEGMVKQNLVNGEISCEILKEIIGCKPEYPIQIVGAIKLEKCFLRPYYRLA